MVIDMATADQRIYNAPMLEDFCSKQSILLREEMAGTASQVGQWLLIEYSKQWGRDIASTPLFHDSRTWIEKIELQFPLLRIQLVRNPSNTRKKNDRIWVGGSRGVDSWMQVYECDVSMLSQFDVAAALSRGPVGNNRDMGIGIPQYLVCVHGKRDQCCAKYGLPIFDAAHKVAPGRVWQTSHLGGHRFAPTMLVLPEGILYGRLDGETVLSTIRSHDNGSLGPLDCMRGNVQWSSEAQAADIALRKKYGIDAKDRLTFVKEVSGQDTSHKRFVFSIPGIGCRNVAVSAKMCDKMRAASCGAQPKPLQKWVVEEIPSHVVPNP